MPDVILIQPPIREFYLTRKRTIPYGLASIAASIEQQGFSCTIIDALARDKTKDLDLPDEFKYLTPYFGKQDISLFSLFHKFRHFGYSFEHIGALVKKARPFLVGISSLFTPYANEALKTANAVKRFYPDAVVVLGGHHPTHFPKETLEHKSVDFVLRGEGERSMAILASQLKNKLPSDTLDISKIKNVPGIAFEINKQLHVSKPDWGTLSNTALPAFDKVDWNYYQRNKKAAIAVVASRGCPFPCSYCAVSSSSSYAGFRLRPVEKVLDEIKSQSKDKDIGFIDFEDENLTLKKAWILDLLDGIKMIFKGKTPELRAMNGLYPPSLDFEILLAMKEAGFKTLNLSVGSFSSSQLKQFKRPDVRKDYDRVLDMAAKLDMECVSYILGAAPGQTAKSSLEDLFMLAQRRTLVGFSVFYPAPGSLDYARCQKDMILPDSFSSMRSTCLPVDHTTSRTQAATLMRLARVINYLKSNIDKYRRLPKPFSHNECNQTKSDLTAEKTSFADREKISELLVRMFLFDAKLRGMDLSGNIYFHKQDTELCDKFIKEIKKIDLMGVKNGPVKY